MKPLFVILAILFPSLAMAGEEAGTKVVIVLDTSGSMGEMMARLRIDKMTAAQNAIIDVLKEIPDSTELGIITFEGWVYPLGKIDREAIKTAVHNTSPSGGTPLGEYMELGANALLAAREKAHNYGTYKLLVVTDGEATDSWVLEKNLPDILRRGIILDSIGVDMSSEHTLSRNSHRYMSADNPESLKTAISASLAEVSGDSQDVSDDWDLLAAIPDEAASQIIETLTTVENQPIGKPANTPVADTANNAAGAPTLVSSNLLTQILLGILALIVVCGLFAYCSR